MVPLGKLSTTCWQFYVRINHYSNYNIHFWNFIKNISCSLVLWSHLLYNSNRNIWCECRPPILRKKGGIEMKKRTFIIKVLRLIAIILLLLTLLVIAIKIWHSFISDWVSILILLEVTFTFGIECSSFLFYSSFLDIFIITQKRTFGKSSIYNS